MRYKKKRKSSIKEVVLLILIVVIGFSIVITQGIFLNKSISIHRIVKISQFKISYNYLKSVTVIIKDYINNKYTAMGTGVIIKYENGYTYIITDFHVINVVGNDIRIQNGLRQRYVEIVKINKKKETDGMDNRETEREGEGRREVKTIEMGEEIKKRRKNSRNDIELAKEVLQKKSLYYSEDEHYDTISAFIKSMRGGDPDAVLYWLAKMIEAGEDPLYIARRIVICASEDVGNADPRALQVAVSAMHAVEFTGMPEARIPLAQAAIYIAMAPKSNASYSGIERALSNVREERLESVPAHLKGTGYKGASRLGAGAGYKYPHDYKGQDVDQQYITKRNIFFFPSEEGYERTFKKRLCKRRSR